MSVLRGVGLALFVALIGASAGTGWAQAPSADELSRRLPGEWVGNIGVDKRLRRLEIREIRELSDGRRLAAGSWNFLDAGPGPNTIAITSAEAALTLTLTTQTGHRLTLSYTGSDVLVGSFVLADGRQYEARLFKTVTYVPALRDTGPHGAPAAVVIGEPFPNFRFVYGDRSERHLADFRGRPVLIVRWELWCPVCIPAMPDLNRLRAKYSEADLAMILISSSTVSARSYLAQHTYNLAQSELKGGFPAGLAPKVPAYILIDRSGKLIDIQIRRGRIDEIEQALGLAGR